MMSIVAAFVLAVLVVVAFVGVGCIAFLWQLGRCFDADAHNGDRAP